MGNKSTKKRDLTPPDPETTDSETPDPFPDIQESEKETDESTYYSSQSEQIKRDKIRQFVVDLKGFQNLYIKYGGVKLVPGREIFFACLEEELLDMDSKNLRSYLELELINLFPFTPSREEFIEWLVHYLTRESESKSSY